MDDSGNHVLPPLVDIEVGSVVIPHGTDTLEETPYCLEIAWSRSEAAVLTYLGGPGTANIPDGPQNILDSFTAACYPGAQCVVVGVRGLSMVPKTC